MGDLHPAQLHQLMRSWLLAEDPYGMKGSGGGKIEPYFGDRSPRAAAAGEAAVGKALEPKSNPARASAEGGAAVDSEMDAVNTDAWKAKMAGRKAQRAQAGQEGRAAVADAVSPRNVRAMIAEQANQPTWAPGESAAYSGMVGENAVAGAMPPPQGPAGWYPMTPPGHTFGPQPVVNPETESTNQDGYAPSGVRAGHYGKDAVSRELDKPE